jgi:N-formylglutamate amidohydrolase
MKLSKYIETEIGNIPIILSCPHGGYKKPRKILEKTKGYKNPDTNTYFIAKLIIDSLKQHGVNLHYILSKVHRSKVDLNRPPQSSSAFMQNCIEARKMFFLYHDTLIKLARKCVEKFDRALVIDFHGFTKPSEDYPDIIFGHIFGKTLDSIQDNDLKDCDKFWGCFQLQNELSNYFSIDNGFVSSEYNVAYSGGYITHQFYNIEKVSAIQVEVAKYIRRNFKLTKVFVQAFITAINQCNLI